MLLLAVVNEVIWLLNSWYSHHVEFQEHKATEEWYPRMLGSWAPETTVERKTALSGIKLPAPAGGKAQRLTLRKCRVARKRGASVSWAFAHCSANGVKASRHSWQTSELILITTVKEQRAQRAVTQNTTLKSVSQWTAVLEVSALKWVCGSLLWEMRDENPHCGPACPHGSGAQDWGSPCALTAMHTTEQDQDQRPATGPVHWRGSVRQDSGTRDQRPWDLRKEAKVRQSQRNTASLYLRDAAFQEIRLNNKTKTTTPDNASSSTLFPQCQVLMTRI